MKINTTKDIEKFLNKLEQSYPNLPIERSDITVITKETFTVLEQFRKTSMTGKSLSGFDQKISDVEAGVVNEIKKELHGGSFSFKNLFGWHKRILSMGKKLNDAGVLNDVQKKYYEKFNQLNEYHTKKLNPFMASFIHGRDSNLLNYIFTVPARFLLKNSVFLLGGIILSLTAALPIYGIVGLSAFGLLMAIPAAKKISYWSTAAQFGLGLFPIKKSLILGLLVAVVASIASIFSGDFSAVTPGAIGSLLMGSTLLMGLGFKSKFPPLDLSSISLAEKLKILDDENFKLLKKSVGLEKAVKEGVVPMEVFLNNLRSGKALTSVNREEMLDYSDRIKKLR